MPTKPKRSTIFAWWTAEEDGLVGSRWWTDNPTVPIENINGMINMDMIGRISEDKLYVGGVGTSPGFSAMLEAAKEEAAALLRE